MPGFGGEVKLTGEEAYRRSLTAITEALKENGIKNGVEGLEIVDRARLKELEPSVGHVPVAALYSDGEL